MNYTWHYVSPLGSITLASDGEALTGLWFDGQRYFGAGLGPEREDRVLPVFTQAEGWLEAYFRGERPDFPPPLRPQGTAFQQAVWETLLTIPRGQTTTYGKLAEDLGARPGHFPTSARAVGGAVGHNPISLIIPCHRVVGAGGSLTGYAGGVERKLRLLELEGADLSRLFIPGLRKYNRGEKKT